MVVEIHLHGKEFPIQKHKKLLKQSLLKACQNTLDENSGRSQRSTLLIRRKKNIHAKFYIPFSALLAYATW